MKVLFICDNFPPFIRGGAIISTFWQTQQLKKKGIEVAILAPKYKDRTIFLKLFFTFHLLQKILKIHKKENFDLIHCQGKYSAPAAVLAKYLLKIPLIITLRDYGGICNHGFCLWNNKKGCNLLSFYKKDFIFYFKNYLKNKNFFKFVLQLGASYFGRLNTYILKFFMTKADKFACVSNFIKDIYSINGYDQNKMTTIYNIYPLKLKKETKLPLKIAPLLKKFKYRIVYAGKLSLGKGAGHLIKAAQEIIKSRKDVLFIFSGKIIFPIKKYQSSQIVFPGQLINQQILRLISLSSFVCIPSVWPEPLSRVTIEAFYLKKPVLSSDTGGQPELVSNKTGWLCDSTYKDLRASLKKALLEVKIWQEKGEAAKKQILIMEQEAIKKLLAIYNSLI